MAKRKEPDTPSKIRSSTTKRLRRDDATAASPSHAQPAGGESDDDAASNGNASGLSTPSKHGKARQSVAEDVFDLSDDEPTPRPNGTTLFTTPNGRKRSVKSTPTGRARADRSAKRKSVQTLIEAEEDDDWDSSAALAREILDEDNAAESVEHDTVSVEPSSAPVTPSKRGRPKGAKNKRSPTPEGDLPPEERYFFQNRMGPPRVSSNIFTSLGLLAHDEYFELMRDYKDHHESEKAYLMKLHGRAFLQWEFEMRQGFSLCLYGYGSKRKLLHKFTEWLYPRLKSEGQPRIVVLNGYAPRINLRSVLSTIGSALVDEDEQMKLMGQPHDMIDTILSHLTHHVDGRLVLVINSIDAAALRRVSTQSLLARLASHPRVNLIASADTPTFPVLWNSTLKDQFRFLFHDCTTFAPYDVETNPVDDVNELLGRKNRRVGGKEGVGFVLKSLPENARNLYRVLLMEILTVLNGGLEGIGEDDEDAEVTRRAVADNSEETGIEYRALYQKASEEFICSSDMNFRFLLKEFHDHQMLTSRRDASGTELLGVPLSKDEMEAVLEDLVIG